LPSDGSVDTVASTPSDEPAQSKPPHRKPRPPAPVEEHRGFLWFSR
jgi:hypothetical protein